MIACGGSVRARRRAAGRGGLLALWEAVVRAEGIPPYILPGPLLIAETLVDRWAEPLGLAAGDPAHHLRGARRRGAVSAARSRCCFRSRAFSR